VDKKAELGRRAVFYGTSPQAKGMMMPWRCNFHFVQTVIYLLIIVQPQPEFQLISTAMYELTKNI
jgi:hypothetical protein